MAFGKIGLPAAAALTALAAATAGEACTSLVLTTTSGAQVYGRTMEFGVDLQSEGVVIPRGYALAATGPDGKPGLGWTTTYAAAGLNAFGLPILADGVNEKGLAGGMLLFPGYAGYVPVAEADPARAIAGWDFLTWALTNFATVAEVRAALGGIEISDVPQPQMGGVLPLHYTLVDETGARLVVEPIGGKLVAHDNPLGVLTNAPSFDWHITNLGNYVNLTSLDALPREGGGIKVAPIGQGSGMLGMPGDATPPSRFIRAATYVLSVEDVPDGPEAVRLTEHVMNNFDIPPGWIRLPEGQSGPLETTQWTGIADTASRTYYVKSYGDATLREIDLMSFDLDAKTIRTAALAPEPVPPALDFSAPAN